MEKNALSVVTNNNPLLWNPQAIQMPVGLTIWETLPSKELQYICRIDGEYISRADWHYKPPVGTIIEWIECADEHALKNLLRPLLQIGAAIITVALVGLDPWLAFAWAVGSNLAINALLPIDTQQNKQQQPRDVYSITLSGNQEDLNGPIPRICGRHQIFPKFACKPYIEHKTDKNPDGDQYYYAIFAIGYGEYDIESATIDDSKLSAFQDVLVNNYLAPGVLPSTASANVVTAVEVSGNKLEYLKYVGAFVVCGPLFTAQAIGIDIVAPQGLSNKTVTWRVEIQEVNQFGIAQTAWSTLATESLHANTNTTQRRSYKYVLPTPIRCQIRLVRTNAEDKSAGVNDEIQWAGMRGYLAEPASLNPYTSHYEIVLRASSQLNQLTQRRVALIVKAKTRYLDANLTWQPAAFTRNPMWWLADMWTDAIWGEGIDQSFIDLQTIYDLSVECDDRFDHFDFVFDAQMDGWEAAQLIARVARARCFRREGIYTLTRDKLVTSAITAFTARNTVPRSMAVTEKLPSIETPDGVVIEYYDNRQWDWMQIECPCPTIPVMHNPIYMRIPGITGPVHAEREGLYEAAQMFYRTRTVSCVTELQGIYPSVLAPVKWQPDLIGYGQTGDVIGIDESTNTLTLSEDVDFTAAGTKYITFVRDDGSLTDPVVPTAGAALNQVVLDQYPDLSLELEGTTKERTKFFFGTSESQAELAKVISIEDGGKSDSGAQLFKLTAVVEDDRVHDVDTHLVGLGSDPDYVPPISPTGTDDGVNALIVNLNTHTFTVSVALNTSGSAFCTFHNNGTIETSSPNSFFPLINEWLLGAPAYGGTSPFTTTDTVKFEIRATRLSGSLALTGTFDSWLNLNTNRTWTLPYTATTGEDPLSGSVTLPAPITAAFLIEIRDVATATIQASAVINLSCYPLIDSGGTGGGGGGGP